MKFQKYDFQKAKQIIEHKKELILSASLGMVETWKSTNEVIFEGGKYIKDLEDNNLKIAGVPGSVLDVPTLLIKFLDGTRDIFPVWVEAENVPLTSGFFV
jgi:hypothetical protein